MAALENAMTQLERFEAQTQAKLRQLSDQVEEGEHNLHALVGEFETRSREEAERVEREVEARRKAGTSPTAEPEVVVSAELALIGVLERLPARDIGPGWKF